VTGIRERIKGALRSGPGRHSRDQFLAWARSQAVAFDLNGTDATDAHRLEILDPALSGKRIAFLGEIDHFVHEKYAFRLRFIRYLVTRGFRWLGEEMGRSDGRRADRYLETGDERRLERISMSGYRGDRRADRDDDPPPGSLLSYAWGAAYPLAALAGEQRRMMRAIRGMDASGADGRRMHCFGFDVDYIAGGAYADIDELLQPFASDRTLMRLRELLARVPGESIGDEIARIDRALAFAESQRAGITGLLGAANFAILLRDARGLRDSLDYARVAYPAREWSALNSAMAHRERVMARQVDDVLSDLRPGEKAILMSHAFHLAKDYGAIRTRIGAGPGGDSAPALGTYLARKYPGEVFSAWMLYDRGSNADPYPGNRREFGSVPGSLNSILAEVGPAFALPTAGGDAAARIFDTEMPIASGGAVLGTTSVSRQADAIFFVREVTPLHS
jgi:erythromycin esterase-like protein